MTISSWLNFGFIFGRPAPPGRGSAAGRKCLAPPYHSQRAVFASLCALQTLPPIMKQSRSTGDVRAAQRLQKKLNACFMPKPKPPKPQLLHLGLTARTHDISEFRQNFPDQFDRFFVDRSASSRVGDPGGLRVLIQSWQWVTFYDPWPTWPISQLTCDPWPVTHDYSPVTVTVWRLRTLGRGKEVSMRFRFHTVPTPSPPVHNKFNSHQLIFLPWNFNRIWALSRKSVRFRSCLLVFGHALRRLWKSTNRLSKQLFRLPLLIFREPENHVGYRMSTM